MNLSGILVIAVPERCDEVAEALAALPGIEVYQKDVVTGKIIVVQEADSIDGEVAGARALQEVPGVVSVSMVYHYFGEDPSLEGMGTPVASSH